MNRLAIVGCEASGKTVFMSALTDHYREALVPENAAANRFARFGQRQMRSLRLWPPATNPGRTLEMEWSLRRNGEVLAEVKMLEFGGETFRAAFREDDDAPSHQKAVKDLLDYLSEADFIIILVSLKELFREAGDVTMEEFERDTESIWVTRGLLDFIRENLPLSHVAIGLTQADRYRKELAACGGAEKTLAARWPSIRAVAANIPVVEVASVSGTDEEGRPEENYRTDGVLPVMRVMSRNLFGSTEKILAELSTLKDQLEHTNPREALGAFNTKVRKFTARIQDLSRADALCGEEHGRESLEFEAARDRFRDAAKAVPKPKAKKAKKPVHQKPAARLAFWLAFLAAAAVPFVLEYGHFNLVPPIRKPPAEPAAVTLPAPIAQPAPVTQPATVEQTETIEQTETNAPPETVTPLVTTNTPAPVEATPATNLVSTATSPQQTNDLISVSNVIAQATEPVTETNAPAAFRIWHDHNGKAIEARWLSTSADGQAVFLETRKGRKIRAVLYKFSEEDQTYVKGILHRSL